MKTSPNQAQSSGYSFAANTPHKDQSNEPVRQPKSTQDAFIYALIAVVISASLITLMLKIIGVVIGEPHAVPGIVYLSAYGFILVFGIFVFFCSKYPKGVINKFVDPTDPCSTDADSMIAKEALGLPGFKFI